MVIKDIIILTKWKVYMALCIKNTRSLTIAHQTYAIKYIIHVDPMDVSKIFYRFFAYLPERIWLAQFFLDPKKSKSQEPSVLTKFKLNRNQNHEVKFCKPQKKEL